MTEFSRLLPLADVNRSPVRLKLDAEAAELPALAARMGVPSVARLHAFLTVRRTNSRLRVDGTFEAIFDQVCVVSLETFQNKAAGEIEEELVLTDDPDSLEVDLDPDAVTAEPLSGDTLDLGEIIVQNLLLAIDPHPRASDAELTNLDFDPKQLGAADNPFAALGKLKLER